MHFELRLTRIEGRVTYSCQRAAGGFEGLEKHCGELERRCELLGAAMLARQTGLGPEAREVLRMGRPQQEWG